MLRGLTLDAGGTLVFPVQGVGLTYARFAADFGVTITPEQAERGFRGALRATRLTQAGDGRPFWREVVTAATGSADPALFEALYAHYARPEAWRVAEHAPEVLAALRARGLRLAVLSNWDERLPPLLHALGLGPLFELVLCSGALGFEKPDPRAYLRALALLDLAPDEVLHVGDRPEEDIEGPRRVGMRAWTGPLDFRVLLTAITDGEIAR